MAEQESSGEATTSSEPTPLSEVFGGSSETHVEHQKSASETDEKDEHQDEGDQKFPVGESSSEDDEEKSESDEQEEKTDDTEPETLPVSKTDEKKAGEKKEEKPDIASKWEADDNPFKQRWKDTAAAQNREHQENLQLRNNLAQLQQEQVRLRKMVDGTYDPEVDEPKQPSYEDVATRAIDVGKTMASHQAALDQFGAEKVNAVVGEFNQLFGADQMINKIVLQSKSPIHEAMRIMDRYHFEQKYGSTPAEWHKSIRVEADKELRESIRKELTEEIMGKMDKKKAHPSFSSSRGSNGLGKGTKPNSSGRTPLKDVFK